MIRVAAMGDAPAMGQVLSDWIDATPWMPRIHTRAEDAGFCAHLVETADVWILDLRGEAFSFEENETETSKVSVPSRAVSGFLARQGESVDALYLAPGARGEGWGRKLLDSAREGRERLTLWTFQANTAAIAFYKACGFEVVEDTDGAGNEERLPDVRMTWKRIAP